MAKLRPYLFYDTAVSLCAECLRRVEAKILIQDERVYLEKWCPRHGRARVLLADDAQYYRRARERFIKAPEMPGRFATPMRFGCPYDCGLCPDHMQHSCLGLVEITDACNLRCPVCYASSGPERTRFRSTEEIEAMLDALVASEGAPDVVQISGGEPTLHPRLFEILDLAKARPIRHLMLNTNGIRLARDPELAARLAGYGPGFEVYLQFDSLEADPHRRLRGADLRDVHRRAIDHLNESDLSTTLVVTVAKGVNDDELGAIIDFALEQPCVRGVTFQPVQHAGRTEGYDPARDRLTLTEVRRRILAQSPLFSAADVIPVPCNPDALAMAYALKLDGGTVPLTGLVDPQALVEGAGNTIVFERDDTAREQVMRLFSTSRGPQDQAACLHDLLCCLPRISAPADLGYRNLFRVLIMQFFDAWSFDLRAVKRSCVHIVQPDGRIIPFDTFNLLYRDDRAERLAGLRAELEPSAGS